MAYPVDDARDPETGTVMFFWVSRDSHPRTGALEPVVDLWFVRPNRYRYSRIHKDVTMQGACWRSLERNDKGSISLVGHHGRFTLEACRKWCGTIPETDLELIVVGRP